MSFGDHNIGKWGKRQKTAVIVINIFNAKLLSTHIYYKLLVVSHKVQTCLLHCPFSVRYKRLSIATSKDEPLSCGIITQLLGGASRPNKHKIVSRKIEPS